MSNFLGTGYDYPLQLAGDGKFKMVSDDDKIKASLRAILGTPVGSRIMNRRFGCRVHELNFENDEDVVNSLAAYYTRVAIHLWEPRIDLTQTYIDVTREGPNMLIHIEYNIVGSNTTENFVYPYYITAA